MIKLVPAPGRQLRTYSMMMLIATGVFDLAVVLLKALTDLHVMTAETALIINAVMAFLTGVVRLIQQNVAVTTEEKTQIVEFAAAQPMKPGQQNVQTRVDGMVAPSTPAAKAAADLGPLR